MQKLTMSVEHIDGNIKEQSLHIARMYNFGSATRDPQSAVAHQEEVAKSGIHIAVDVPAPRIYPIGLHALDTSDSVFVQSTQTSGEWRLSYTLATRFISALEAIIPTGLLRPYLYQAQNKPVSIT